MITISKDGLKEHYKHVNALLSRGKAIPRQAIDDIGYLTLREAKLLATDRINRGANSGNYRRSINVDYRGSKDTYSAIIGASSNYAAHLEYGTQPHIIRPKIAGGVLAWKSPRFSSLKTKSERTSRIAVSSNIKSHRTKYANMLFTKVVHHPGTKPKWILRDAIFNIAPQHIPIITHYLQGGAKL